MVPVAAAASLVVLLLRLYSAAAQALPGCPTSCGEVSMPYPFGADQGCYLPGFNLTCDRTSGSQPRLLVGDGTMQVVDISVANSTLRVMDRTGAVNLTYNDADYTKGNSNGNVTLLAGSGTWGGLSGTGPFVVSETRNQFIVTGCNVQATLMGNSANIITGCSSFCSINDKWTGFVSKSPYGGEACAGIGCCQTPVPIGRPSYSVKFQFLDLKTFRTLPNTVRIAERGWFDREFNFLLNVSSQNSSRVAIPVVLEWVVASAPMDLPGVAMSGCPEDPARSACVSSLSSCHNFTGNYRSGYVCQCNKGYQGNPYLAGGCQDIDECVM